MVRFSIECTLPFPAEDFWRIRDAPSFLRFIVADGLLKNMTASEPEQELDGWLKRVQHYCPARVDCPNIIRGLVGDTMFEVADHQRWNDDLHPLSLSFSIRPSFLAALSSTHGDLSVKPFVCDPPAESESTMDEDNSNEHDIENNHPAVSLNPPHSPNSDADEDTDPVESDTGSSVGDAASPPSVLLDDPVLAIDALPAPDKSVHLVEGVTRVRILTLGWFVERAIVHNLRQFYTEYPSTILRFRHSLYDQFAAGDHSVPISLVVDRFLQAEAELIERERAEAAEAAEDDDLSDDEVKPMEEELSNKELKKDPLADPTDISSVTTPCPSQQSDSSSDGLLSD